LNIIIGPLESPLASFAAASGLTPKSLSALGTWVC
jgi:hypothetical protein